MMWKQCSTQPYWVKDESSLKTQLVSASLDSGKDFREDMLRMLKKLKETMEWTANDISRNEATNDN